MTEHNITTTNSGCLIRGPEGSVLYKEFEIPLSRCLSLADEIEAVTTAKSFASRGSLDSEGYFVRAFPGYLVLGRNVKFHDRDGHWEALVTHIDYADVPGLVVGLKDRDPLRDLIKCGDCGGGNFAVFHEKSPEDPRVGGQGALGFGGHMILKCQGCGEETKILPTPARLTTEGNACGGWRS